ncbi:Uncharacterised protein [Mycolicibacterium phlei]|nr:Uncharacterised protein [Mycolicibacterium phlei]
MGIRYTGAQYLSSYLTALPVSAAYVADKVDAVATTISTIPSLAAIWSTVPEGPATPLRMGAHVNGFCVHQRKWHRS